MQEKASEWLTNLDEMTAFAKMNTLSDGTQTIRLANAKHAITHF